MTSRDDLDSQATGGRAVRRRSQRARQAWRLIARTRWLDADLVYWSGQVGELPQFTGGLAPLRAVLQGKLSELPAGLYAVAVGLAGLPSSGDLSSIGEPLRLEVRAVEPVTHELVAATARAIEAVAKFPRAAAGLVGPIRSWREGALARLDSHRRALAGAESVKARGPGALALEARAFWLGAGQPPSMTLSEAVLASWTARPSESDSAPAHLAAVALGKRHLLPACHSRLAAWAAAGRALDRWTAASAAWAAAALGPATIAGMVATTPGLNDALACSWADERRFDRARTTAGEVKGLARLMAVIDAVRREPERRHGLLSSLTLQYLQLRRARIPGQNQEAPGEVAAAFRRLALDLVYDGVRDLVAAVPYEVPDSLPDLVDRWLGHDLLGQRTWAYVDNLMAGAALALGDTVWFGAGEDHLRDLSQCAPSGSAVDPDGAAAAVGAANRLRWKGAPDAIGAMADWLDTCCPLVALGSFWRDVLTVVPTGAARFDAEGARRFVSSLETHERRVVTELALGQGDQVAAMRALLPGVLARGPEATGRVFLHDLWMEDKNALDAALRWMEAAERKMRAADSDARIPVPRLAFSVANPDVRDALCDIGLRAWGGGGLQPSEVEVLLGALANGTSRSGAAHWPAALPRLVDVAVRLASRVFGPAKGAEGEVSDRAELVRLILDACARWHSAGHGDTGRLARILADRWPSAGQAAADWDPEREDHCNLLVALSEGRIGRFLALLQHRPPPREYAWRAVDGWALAAAHPVARAWLSACLDRTELVTRVVRLLERLALVARLDPGLAAARFFEPLNGAAGGPLALPGWVGSDARVTLEQVVGAAALAGEPAGIPGTLQRILDRGAIVEGELAALRARALGGGTLSTSECARLDRLEALVADPAVLEGDLRAQLERALPKQVALAGLAALESLVSRDLDRRWQAVLGGDRGSQRTAAWDNALHMLMTVKHNRRVLLRLLRHAARGDQVWMCELGPNRAFLEHLASAGLRPAAWLAERSLVVERRGGPLLVYATRDPLEVLQMGSLFGTCLSAGKFNAHAAVAAAVEVNKRVLYMRDGAGRVLGRQLLAITRDGEIIGFTCYGAGSEDPGRHGAWVKLGLELLALDLARAAGARLVTASRISAGLDDSEERALELFCRGYVDSPEAFDWWIEELQAADSQGGDGDRALLRSLLERPVPADRDARTSPEGKRDELGWAACRALLYLGADAPALPPAQEEALGLTQPGVRSCKKCS